MQDTPWSQDLKDLRNKKEVVKLPFDKVNIQPPKHQPSRHKASAAEFLDCKNTMKTSMCKQKNLLR